MKSKKPYAESVDMLYVTKTRGLSWRWVGMTPRLVQVVIFYIRFVLKGREWEWICHPDSLMK